MIFSRTLGLSRCVLLLVAALILASGCGFIGGGDEGDAVEGSPVATNELDETVAASDDTESNGSPVESDSESIQTAELVQALPVPATSTPTATQTPTITPTWTPRATATPYGVILATRTNTPTATPTPTNTATVTPTPTAT